MKLKLILISLIISTFLAAQENIIFQKNNKRKIKISADHNFSPYEFSNNGKPDGFNIELITEICDLMDIEYTIELKEWSKILKDLKEHKTDVISGMFFSDDRDKIFDFSTPYIYVSSGIFSLKSKEIKSVSELINKKVLVQLDDSMHDYLKKSKLTKNITTCSDQYRCLAELQSGNYDAALISSMVQGNHYLRENNIDNVVMHKTNAGSQKYCFAVTKDNSELLFILNEGLNILKMNGRYDELYDKWFSLKDEIFFDFFREYLIPALLACVLLTILIFSWIYTLRSKLRERTQLLTHQLQETEKQKILLSEHEDKLKSVLASIDDIVFVLDKNFNFVSYYISPSSNELYVSPETFVGKDFREILPPSVSAKFIKAISNVRDKNGIETIDYFLNENYYRANISKVVDINGDYTGITAVVKNVSDTNNIESALKSSKIKYDSLFEGSGEAIIIFSKENIIEFNNQAYLLFGFNENEISSLKIGDLFPHLQVSGTPSIMLADKILKALKVNDHKRFNWTYRKKDGSTFESEVILSTFLQDNKILFSTSIRDISERIATEKKIESQREFIECIINSIPQTIISLDKDYKITHWNKHSEERYHLLARDVIGKQFFETLPELTIFQEQIRESVYLRKIYVNIDFDSNYLTKNYNEQITIYPLKGADFNGAVLIINDVTKHNKLLNELYLSRKMDAIGQLAGGISHDFNNMLGGILGAAEFLIKVTGENKYLSIIKESSLRASDLTQKLLDFSRKTKIEKNIINVQKPLSKAIDILERSINKNVKMSVEYDNKTHGIIGDSVQLQNVFLNLGINSSHAMPDGGTLEFIVKETELSNDFCKKTMFDINAGKYVSIEVKDNGVGIPTEIIDKIFEPFFTTKEEGKGTGLGLASVFGIVTNHGGAITVDSKINVGTSFTIFLPTIDSSREIIQDLPENIIKGRGKILVVDDEQVILTTTKSLLERLGYIVSTAHSGKEALDILETQKYDLIIIDLIMPDFDGKRLFKEIIKKYQHQAIIMFSGFANEDNIKELYKEGLKGFIKKPFSFATLSKAVADAFSY